MLLPRRNRSLWGQKQHRLGVLSLEYMMILALVVIPLALCVPLLMHMIVVYSSRIIWVIRSPFG
jgi:hypothetical protein